MHVVHNPPLRTSPADTKHATSLRGARYTLSLAGEATGIWFDIWGMGRRELNARAAGCEVGVTRRWVCG
ncbi:hypothetical protein P153DRAFT_195023 [Dothidotthia symphoricarpi CBS 119687]|uniref:Uncharacterized protein n=1 Tax=Dothidotthia symphoricarpi CBS 119687 TaxID=1392245 RepID=A0A6A6AKH5_9PLEO|nr:uncharacterized protein P153DRAFT_195023 [Dothidotthia symphoricarpi CBS 119687]KAF2131414.1 hypothetical protein P153DRAFT_195023 [Dothidotthia symphoricarpi CBS 119687]